MESLLNWAYAAAKSGVIKANFIVDTDNLIEQYYSDV
jgi:hypothetical protein